MKKYLLGLGLLSLFWTSQVHADEQHNLHLNNYGKNKETITIKDAYKNDICIIEVVLGEVDDDGNYTIGLTVKNQNELFTLYVFGKSYGRSHLRSKFHPSIVYDKGLREESTQSCEGFTIDGENYLQILPTDDKTVEIKGNEKNQSHKCTIPLYFAKPIGWLWKRHSLMDVRKEELNIIVDIKPSKAFMDLSADVDKMIKNIYSQKYVVCKHGGKKHHPELEEQKAVTRDTLDSLFDRINKAKTETRPGSMRYKEFETLELRLKEVDLDKIPVENCKITPQGCSCPPQIAKMDLQQVYNRMEELYQLVYLKKKDKSEILKEVKALKVHAGHTHNGPKYLKNKIDDYYDRINNL